MVMTTDVIDIALNTSAFPSTYTGPGTLIGNPRRDTGDNNHLYGYFTSDGNAVNIPLGFKPLSVRLKNMTDGIDWEWQYGMAATDTRKTTLTGPVIATDTTSAIVPSELSANGGGNWQVLISAAAAGTAKLILFEIEG